MSATASSRDKRVLAIGWLVFAGTNLWLAFAMAGDEILPYYLIWASFALVYGLVSWSHRTATLTFWGIAVATSLPIVVHAAAGGNMWSHLSQAVWMSVLVYLLIWHVNRHRAAQRIVLELEAAERSRAAHQELTTRFASHEIRTRLSVARGFVELIKDSTTESSTRSDAQFVMGELDKAAALNKRLLTLVQVELNTSPVLIAFYLDDLVETVLHRWVSTADRVWSLDTSPGAMSGDPERLETALDCLLENAVKFTDKGDTIGINAHVDGSDVVISVSDSGIGIPQEDVSRIFDISRTGRSVGNKGGNGLGLAIVAAVVEAQHGSVEVTSVVGSGTCFTIRCPDSGLDPNAEGTLMGGTLGALRTQGPVVVQAQ